MKKRYQLAIFDMDGTVFDTERIHLENSLQVIRELGYDIDPVYISRYAFGLSRQEYRRILLNKLSDSFPYDTYIEGIIRLNQDKDHSADQSSLIKPGIKPLLEHLKSMSIPSVLCTSTPHETAFYSLEASGLLPYFDLVIGGDEVNVCKPDPEIFLTAAAGYSVDPSRCVVFEDSANGIVAANRAGMDIVYIPDIAFVGKEEKEMATYIFKSADEAISLF